MYRILILTLLLLTACGDQLVIGVDDSDLSEEKLAKNANSLYVKNEYNEAIESYESLVGLFPTSKSQAEYQARLFSLYEKKSEFAELEEFSEHVMEDSPSAQNPAVLYYYGVANLMQSKTHIFDVVSKDAGGKDLIRLEKAAKAFKQFIARNPKHKLVKSANEKLKQAREMIAQVHFQVSKFYQQRGHEKASSLRLEQITQHYADTSYADLAKQILKNKKKLT